MSTPYLGQIAIFSFGFTPKGWASCAGQLLPVNQNQALFSLLGTQFGGNGSTSFALPNLQGAFGLGQGIGNVIGTPGGETAHTLTAAEMGVHTHPLLGSGANATTASPIGNFPAIYTGSSGALYAMSTGISLGSGSSSNAGGGGPHPNMPPFLVLNVCIALVGIFPPRN